MKQPSITIIVGASASVYTESDTEKKCFLCSCETRGRLHSKITAQSAVCCLACAAKNAWDVAVEEGGGKYSYFSSDPDLHRVISERTSEASA